MKYFLVSILGGVVLSFGLAAPLGALSLSQFPDSSPIRALMIDQLYQRMSKQSAVRAQDFTHPQGGASVRFQLTQEKSELFFMFLNQSGGQYPLFSPGNYFVQVNEKTGRLDSVKIILQNDHLSLMTITNTLPQPILEIRLMGMDVVKNVRVPMSFHEVLTLPFKVLVQRTSVGVDWKTVFSDSADATWVLKSVVDDLRRLTAPGGIKEVDDGAMNEKGEFVTIRDGLPLETGGFNCSGFVKWFIDGLVYPYQKSWLALEPLKIRGVMDRGNSFTEPYEEARDPYFGLDWTRNLALKVMALDNPHRPLKGDSADVKDIPYLSYFPNRGYGLENLPFILWWMAVNRPGMALLGSVNGDFGVKPVLNQHRHVTVLLPWFDEDGIFHYAVFEITGESSWASLKKRYPRHYIHLVQVPVSEIPEFPKLLPPL